MLAGLLTETGRVGALGEEKFAANNRVLNAFLLGVKEVNPEAKVMVAFTGSRFDPLSAERLAGELIGQGADLIYAGAGGALEACRKRGVLAFGHLTDQDPQAVNTVVTSAVWNAGPLIRQAVEDVRAGRYLAFDYSPLSMMFSQGTVLTPYYGFARRLPLETRDRVERRRRQIVSGLYRVPAIDSVPVSD